MKIIQQKQHWTNGATFKQINKAELYVSVLTLSKNDNIKFLEYFKQGFRRTITWNKYRFEIRTEPKSNDLDCMIDLTFRNINRSFFLSFENGDDDPARNSFDEYYFSSRNQRFECVNREQTIFFDQLVTRKQEAYEKLVEMPRNDDYTTRILLDYLHHEHYYKLIGIILSRQTNGKQITFVGKLEEVDSAKMFFIIKKQQKKYSKLFFRFIDCNNLI